MAQSWPIGVDPTRYFTTIATALVASPALTPTRANPVAIYIYPGTYTDPLVFVSNVHLFGGTRRDVIVTGAVTWTPGAGVNAPQNLGVEEVDVFAIQFNLVINVDSTGKTASTSTLDLFRSNLQGGATVLSRVGGDTVNAFDCQMSPGALSFNNTTANLFNNTLSALSFTGTSSFEVDGNQIFGTITVNTTTSSRIAAAQILGAVSISGTAQVDFTGSWFAPAATLTVNAGCKADVRMAEYNRKVNLAGVGQIDRTIWRTTFGPTTIGNNVVPIAPPLFDANYGVSIELTTAGAYPPVSAKTNASFTINDPVGGKTYNFTVMKE